MRREQGTIGRRKLLAELQSRGAARELDGEQAVARAQEVARNAAEEASAAEQRVVDEALSAGLHIGAQVFLYARGLARKIVNGEVARYDGEAVFCRFPDGSEVQVGSTVAEAAAAVTKATAKRRADAMRAAQEATVLLAEAKRLRGKRDFDGAKQALSIALARAEDAGQVINTAKLVDKLG